MDILVLFKVLIFGIIEGSIEFFSISSAGYSIVFGDLMDFQSNEKVFEIATQLGTVLAIVFEYRQRSTHITKGLGKEQTANHLVLNLFIMFIPAAIISLLFNKQIKLYLFNPITIAAMLTLSGSFILQVEKRQTTAKPKASHVDDMRPINAFAVGRAQTYALIPGTSCSDDTIMNGMLWGLERKTATEFSFFLAVPIIIATTDYDILKNYRLFISQDIGQTAIGSVATLIVGLLAVKVLLEFVSSKNYVPFAYYRIVFGGLILLTWMLGIVSWNEQLLPSFSSKDVPAHVLFTFLSPFYPTVTP